MSNPCSGFGEVGGHSLPPNLSEFWSHSDQQSPVPGTIISVFILSPYYNPRHGKRSCSPHLTDEEIKGGRHVILPRSLTHN